MPAELLGVKIEEQRKNIISRTNLIIASFLALIVALTVFRYFYGVDIRVQGNDVMAHIYKVWLLSNQIRNLSWPYWGLWDFNWYCGYPFLQLYSPLLYFLSAFLAILLNLSAQSSIQVISFASYPLSAFLMYFCMIQATNNKMASIIGSLSYATVPAFIANLVTVGNPGTLLGFVLFPVLFLLIERSIVGEGVAGVNISIASILLSAIILSAYRLGFAYTCSIFLYMVLYYVSFRRFSIKYFLIIPVALSVSAFYVVPALFYGMTVANISWSAAEPLWTLPYWFVIFLLPANHSSLGIPLFVFGLIVPAFATLKHWKRIEIILEKKKLRIFVLCVMVLFVLTFGFVIPYYERIPLLNNLLLGATVPALSFFAAALCGVCLASVNSHFGVGKALSRKQIGVVFIIVAILFQGVIVYIYHPVSPDRYVKAYEYIRDSDDGWFRVFQVPRQPSSSSISMFSDVQVLDGWYDQGAAKGLEFFILKMMGFADPKGRPYGWGDFYDSTSKALSALRILGVKYVIVDSADPIFPSDVSKTIFANLNSSDLVERVGDAFEPSEQVYLFRMKEWYPVIATDVAFAINSEDELATFYEIVSNRTFNPRSAVFISRNDIPIGVPWSNWTGAYPTTAEPVNLTIRRMQFRGLTLDIRFEVDRASFFYIPISNFPNLQVTVNGVEAKLFRGLPDFVTIYLSSKGSYNLTVSRVLTSFEYGLLILSSSTFVGVICACIIFAINHHRKFNRRHGIGCQERD